MKPAYPIPSPAALLIRTLLLFAALWLSWPATAAAQHDRANQIVHMLDYVAVDYAGAVADGRIADAGEYAEMQDFARQIATLIGTVDGIDSTTRARLAEQARQVTERIDLLAPGTEVATLVLALKRQAIAAWHLSVAPRKAPDIGRGAALYREHCVPCHGTGGHGDGPLASGMEPPPSNFFDRERMAQRSLHGLYNTITLGVAGTAMAAWPQLGDDDRWSLAFYVGGLDSPADRVAEGRAIWEGALASAATPPSIADLATLASLSAREVGEQAPLLTFLTREPGALQALNGDPITVSRRLLSESVAAHRHGELAEARQQAIAAYLEGFELAEASLSTIDAPLVGEIERAMIGFRQQLEHGDATAVGEHASAIDRLLKRAHERLDNNRLSPTAAGISAFGILFREGLEAILVLAAITVGLLRAGAPPVAMRFIHIGWLAALAAGGITWLVAQTLVEISGAAREMTEGVTALASAAILLYVGFWLHDRAHAEHWVGFLGQKVSGAVSRGTLWLLAGIAFLAVYREAFETVLFFQALAAQSDSAGRALTVGAGVAVAALLAVAWAVFRGGMKLPLALFFRLSSALLAALAVAFAGQGVAALQEAGRVAADPVAFLSLPALGVHPTVQTLAAQSLTLAIALAVLLRANGNRRRS